ncbi:MAG: hypothetical protein ACRDGE_04995 [Candidatus Limnocylindria bacterium]
MVGGFTAPKGAREHLGALLVGLFEDGSLRYTGKVGTGYTRDVLSDLADRLLPLVTDRSPFVPAPRVAGATWVRPRLVAQIAFHRMDGGRQAAASGVPRAAGRQGRAGGALERT